MNSIGPNNKNPGPGFGVNTKRSEKQNSKLQPILILLIPQSKKG